MGIAHKDESWRGIIVRSTARRMRLPGRHGGTHMQESQIHSTTIPQPRSSQPQPQPRLNHPSCRIHERFRHNHPTCVILQLRPGFQGISYIDIPATVIGITGDVQRFAVAQFWTGQQGINKRPLLARHQCSSAHRINSKRDQNNLKGIRTIFPWHRHADSVPMRSHNCLYGRHGFTLQSFKRHILYHIPAFE